MTTVLKLGGSVLTEKDREATVDEAALRDAAAAVADHDGDLVVVHGGGSYGHPSARRHGVDDATGSCDATAVRAIHGAVARLNDVVIEALAEAGAGAVPVHPLSAVRREADGAVAGEPSAVAGLLAEGFLPVLHGDVVAHRDRGVTVLSGDDLVVYLARELDADRVGLCSTVPGVLDEEEAVIPTVEDFASVADAVGASDATDVTGGMAGKVRALLDLDAPASVFGPADLSAFLAGERPGTTVRGG
ncbi:MAG: isopentenyl phosphate kinase [Halobacteriaceae archaeon]